MDSYLRREIVVTVLDIIVKPSLRNEADYTTLINYL